MRLGAGNGVFVPQTAATAGPWVSELKLFWAAPGRLRVERASAAGFEVWLPPDGEAVTFDPYERVDDVVRRAIGK